MKTFLLAAAALLAPAAATAQTVSNPATVTPFAFSAATTTNGTYTQTFNTLASTGATGTALPAGFQVTEAGGNADNTYLVGTGSDNGGGSWSFGAAGSTDRALGSIGSGNATQILFGGIFTNGLGATITDLAFAYTGEQWRLGNSTDDGLTFQYLVGATSVSAGNWITFGSALDFAPRVTTGTQGALDGNAAANRLARSGTITGLTLGAGQSFGFRWLDVNSSGNDHGLAVDDLSIAATLASAGAVPEPASWALMIGGFGMVGGALRRRREHVALA